MTDKKNILILCYDNYQRQPRVLRTIEALDKDYTISVAGYSEFTKHKINFINLGHNLHKNNNVSLWYFNKPAIIRFPFSFYHKYVKQKYFYKPFHYEYLYWTNSRKSDFEILKQLNYNLIICHGPDTLPLAVKLAANKIPLIFNAHEYYPLEFEQDKNWLRSEGARFSYIINKYLPRCNHMFCVSNKIQDKYLENVTINSKVISNATNFVNLKPQIPNPNKIKIIHHGIALKERDIETMASLMDYLDDRFELNFLMTHADSTYYNDLKLKFSTNSRIRFLPAVSISNLCVFLNQFDIGYYILPPVNFNTTFALPNKLFEYVQARLCLAFAPSPEMKIVIEKYNLGVIANDFTPKAVAEKIQSLNIDDIMNFKLNSNQFAKELCSEKNQQIILETVNSLIIKCAE